MRKITFVLGLLFMGMVSDSAIAQEVGSPEEATSRRRLTPAVALARLCVSEAGWECFESGDGLAIHEVILRGAAMQDISYPAYARAYARRLFGARPHDVPRLRWVGQLTEECDRPEDWPETATTRRSDGTIDVHPHPAWSNYRERCLVVMARAAQVVADHTVDNVDSWSVCLRPVHDWGGWMDRARAERIGLVEVDCGDTRNDFYCRPGIDPTCVAVDVE